MAENKKGFILYADIQHTIKHLSDEQAGKLFKHLLSYVNDENPETDDVITNLTFEPIKQQLKRDLDKWETTREKRSKAGKASAESRKNKKQHNSTKSTHVKSVEHNLTKSTVSVNDNVNVTVNDNVIQMEVYRKFAHLQISFIEFDKLNAIYSKEKIDDCLDAIENYKKNTGYKSLYLTAKKWLKKDEETNTQKNDGTKKQYQFDLEEALRQAANGELER